VQRALADTPVVLLSGARQTGKTTMAQAVAHETGAQYYTLDVVLEQPDGAVAGVEIKASGTVSASDFAALQMLRDQLGRKFRAGILLYLGDQIVPFGDKLWLVPLPVLWSP
jgi:predicted AAA+ superfamily ATPase